MIIKLLIPTELQEVLKNTKLNKTAKKSLLQVYNALLYKNKKYNKKKINEYFPVPSKYLEKINARYFRFIQILLINDIISYQSINSVYLYEDLFTEKIKRNKYYNTHTGECMRYIFNIDTDKGIETDIEIGDKLYEDEKWYDITSKSLKHINQQIKIYRDSFSRRLHTSITSRVEECETNSYKELFSNLTGYSTIDIVECQPTMLYYYMKSNNITIDDNYNVGDIYNQLSDDRNKAKKMFITWLNSDITLPEISIKFPKISQFVANYKKVNGYKSLGAKLQRIESEIVIDDILNNIVDDINIDFCLTLHDSLIVKNSDVDKVYKYVSSKYKELNFKIENF